MKFLLKRLNMDTLLLPILPTGWISASLLFGPTGLKIRNQWRTGCKTVTFREISWKDVQIRAAISLESE